MSYSKLFVQTYQNLARSHASSMARVQRTGHSWITQAKKDVLGLDALYKRVLTGLRAQIPLVLTAAATGVAALGTAIGTVGSQYELLKAQLATANNTNMFGGKEFWRVMQFRRDNAPMTTAEQMLSAYSTLKNAGLGTSNKALRAYGNLAAGTGMTFDQAANNAANGEQGLNAFGIESTRIDKNGDEWANGEYLRVKFRGITTIIKNESKEIDKYLQGLGNGAFKHGLDNLAATTMGRVNSLLIRLQEVGDRIWNSGIMQMAHKALEWADKMVAKFRPVAEKWIPKIVLGTVDFAQKALPKVWKGIQMITKLAPYVLTFIGVMTMRMIGLKALMAADWIVRFAARALFWLSTLTLRALIFNAVAFAIPVAIGVALAAIAWVGYQVYQYLTKGEAGIAGLRKQFPLLADGVVYLGEKWKEIQPHLMKLIAKGWELIVLLGEKLLPVAKWVFMNVIAPAIMGIIVLMTALIDWTIKAIEYYSEKGLGGVVQDLWDAFKGMFAWLRPEFSWLESIAGAIGKAMGWVGGLMGGGSGGGGNTAGDASLSVDQARANAFVQQARAITTTTNDCLRVVWRAQNAVLSNGNQYSGASPIKSLAAADAASDLARSPLFREYKGPITKAMLNDPAFMKLFHGATAIYNRQSGFSARYGHAEIWDMISKTGQYGKGMDSLNRRTDKQLANVRLFIPVDPNAKSPVALPSGPQSQRPVNNYITVNNQQSFNNPPGQPQAVGRLTGTGIGDSLAQTLPRYTP